MAGDTTAPVPGAAPQAEVFRQLVQANHILHYHNVVDAYGHISVRNPQNADTFFMSRELAPALVSCREDIEEYRVSDASPVNPNAARGYSERFIHSEILKRYKGINVVIHGHPEVIIPFTISSIPLRPVFHTGAAMGAQAPIYDIDLHYKPSDERHTLLVDNQHLGAGLAAGLDPPSLLSKTTTMIKSYLSSQPAEEISVPPYQTILMRGHGFSCVGDTIEQAVYRAVFTCANARVQTTTLLMQGAYNLGHLANRFGASGQESGPAVHEPILYLSDREVKDTKSMHANSQGRPWKLWCAEVANAKLYRNQFLTEG